MCAPKGTGPVLPSLSSGDLSFSRVPPILPPEDGVALTIRPERAGGRAAQAQRGGERADSGAAENGLGGVHGPDGDQAMRTATASRSLQAEPASAASGRKRSSNPTSIA